MTEDFPPTGRARPIDSMTVAIIAGSAAISYGVAVTLLLVTRVDSATAGVAQYLVSGLAPIVAVAIVYVVRVRDARALGIRGVTWRWIGIAVGAGIGTIILNILVAMVVVLLTGPPSGVQADYASAYAGGPAVWALAFLAGAVLTPLGEELLFRGVLANWLLRYGGWIAVPVSAAVFAVSHGITYILPVAFVVGVVTALLFRATASIWPGVIVHAIYNGYVILAGALAASAA